MCQRPGAGNFHACLGDAPLHAGTIGLHRAGIDIAAAARLVDEELQSPLGHADDRAQQHGRQGRPDRKSIKRNVDPRDSAHLRFDHGHRVVLRDERVFEKDVLGAGAAHAEGEPSVDDDGILLGHHDDQGGARIAGIVANALAADQHPVAMVGAAGVRPLAVEDVSILRALACPPQRRHAGNQHAGMAAEDFILPAARHAAGDEGVGCAYHQDPGRRGAAVRDRPLGFDQGAHRQLVTAIGGRRHDPGDAGLMKEVDRAGAELAVGLGLGLGFLQGLDDLLRIRGVVHLVLRSRR